MSEARLIDGLTGELIGGQATLYGASGQNGGQQYTTTSYQTNAYQTGGNLYQTGYATNSGYATNAAYNTGASQSTYVQGPQVVNTTVNTGK